MCIQQSMLRAKLMTIISVKALEMCCLMNGSRMLLEQCLTREEDSALDTVNHRDTFVIDNVVVVVVAVTLPKDNSIDCNR